MIFAPVSHGIFPRLIPPIAEIEKNIFNLYFIIIRNLVACFIQYSNKIYQPEVGTTIFVLYIFQGAI